ncbi:MAG: (Fe-S)-binding protein [Dehalococcoidia bacterium]
MAGAKVGEDLTLDVLGLGEHDGVDEKDLYRCVHCGLCLNVCPTYLELGLETESPRGRLALMKAVAEGRVEYTDRLVGHMELCLQCRACEAACPSAVPFGSLMAATRAQVQKQTDAPWWERAGHDLAFKQLFPYRWRLELGFRLMRLYQDTGLRDLVQRSGLMGLLPTKLAELESTLPPLPTRFFPPSNLDFVAAKGVRRARVGFFSGCIMPLVFGPVNAATVRVLTRSGCDVVIPRDQGCCAALNVHGGEREMARRMARRNIDVFEEAGVDVVVVNSAGCGAMLKEYDELLEHDPAYTERARAFVGKVRDISEYLAELPLEGDLGEIKKRVTFQESCHLVHAQRIKEQPLALLDAIPGLELVEMPGSDRCCGAAGIYQITQRELSSQLLDSKMRDVASTDADLLVTANPGCMIQLDLGLRKAGVPGRSYHMVELLDMAYSIAESSGRP